MDNIIPLLVIVGVGAYFSKRNKEKKSVMTPKQMLQQANNVTDTYGNASNPFNQPTL